MTDKELGTAAGEIFAKAFTLGYETGREYVPVGGRVLTAEQVEDVRALVWLDGRRNFDAFYRLRALFPATEPAEAIDDVDDSRAQDIARAWMRHLGYSEGEVDSLEHAKHEDYGCEREDGGWSCYGESGDSLHKDWDEYDNTAQIVMFVLERSPGVTPAEPAEEETKAERRDPDALAKRLAWIWHDGWDACGERERGYLRRAAEMAHSHYASSPVVPAPTETGPWQTWQEVPDGIPYRAKRYPSGLHYVNRNGVRFLADGSKSISRTMQSHAPFVAAKEG